MPSNDFRWLDLRTQYDAIDTLRHLYNYHRRISRPRIDFDMADILLGFICSELDSVSFYSRVY
jgi:hypothetical protein